MSLKLRAWSLLPALLIAALVAFTCGDHRSSPAPGTNFTLQLESVPPFAGRTFVQPLDLRQAPGDDERWFLVEKRGTIQLLQSGAEPALFADLRDRVDSGPSEAGLLGLAFHPAFAENRQVFLSYTAAGTGPNVALVSRISRFQASADGLRLDPDSEEILLTLDQPFGNHNGGNIVFGPDGFLYIGFGDGGSAGDPRGHGQNPETLLGTILRLDVDRQNPGLAYTIPFDNPFVQGGGAPEIFAWGLRNPWRFSFDRETGLLWAADVGQNAWEEVNIIEAGGNYGWNIREGAHCFEPPTNCPTEGLIDPVTEYPNAGGDCSVTGGFVYRGEELPDLRGTYLFGDFCSGRIWGLPLNEQGLPIPGTPHQLLLQSPARIASFAEGNDGEIYILDFTGGRVFKLTEIRQGAAGEE